MKGIRCSLRNSKYLHWGSSYCSATVVIIALLFIWVVDGRCPNTLTPEPKGGQVTVTGKKDTMGRHS